MWAPAAGAQSASCQAQCEQQHFLPYNQQASPPALPRPVRSCSRGMACLSLSSPQAVCAWLPPEGPPCPQQPDLTSILTSSMLLLDEMHCQSVPVQCFVSGAIWLPKHPIRRGCIAVPK